MDVIDIESNQEQPLLTHASTRLNHHINVYQRFQHGIKTYGLLGAINLFVLIYNIETASIYFISANGFTKHLSESAFIRERASNQTLSTLEQLVTDFGTPINTACVFPFMVLGTICLSLTTQYTGVKRVISLLPEPFQQPLSRFYSISGYDLYRNKIFKLFFNIIMPSFSTGWKSLVASSSLAAWLIADIKASSDITIIFTLCACIGNFIAQANNFFEPLRENLRSIYCFERSKTRRWIKRLLSFFSALAYSLSNSALYYNTINQGPNRIGWTDSTIWDLTDSAHNIFYKVLFGGLTGCFGITNLITYTSRINNMLSPSSSIKKWRPPENSSSFSGSAQDHTLTDRPTPSQQQTEKKLDSKLKSLLRGSGLTGTAFFKLFACYLSVLALFKLITPKIDLITYLLLLLLNLPTFIVHYSLLVPCHHTAVHHNAKQPDNDEEGLTDTLSIENYQSIPH